MNACHSCKSLPLILTSRSRRHISRSYTTCSAIRQSRATSPSSSRGAARHARHRLPPYRFSTSMKLASSSPNLSAQSALTCLRCPSLALSSSKCTLSHRTPNKKSCRRFSKWRRRWQKLVTAAAGIPKSPRKKKSRMMTQLSKCKLTQPS